MRLLNWINSKLFKVFYSHLFGAFGERSRVISPVAIEGPENIFLAKDVFVAAHSCLAAMPLADSSTCELIIGDGCKIGRFNHIYATNRIVIERCVLTANNVYISDNLHAYVNPEVPILAQPIIQKSPVIIGEGSWLGHNACIIGARIGRHCVVGANSVVTQDVPDFSIVVGAPAKIIKRFDKHANLWRPTYPDGSFVKI